MLQTSRPSFTRFLLMLLISILLIGLPHSASATQTTSISDARQLPLGSIVTVKGTVTVDSGNFVSSTFDEGFALQDGSSGIYVSTPTNDGLALGDKAQVTGELQEIFGLLVIVPTDVKFKGHDKKLQPTAVSTGSVNEATEGSLVVVEGTVSQAVIDDTPFGYKFYVDDGSGEIQIFVSVSSNLDLSGIVLGGEVRVVGFSGQFATTYEVQPRVQADIQILN